MKDVSGRRYSVVAATPAGCHVQADSGFTCLKQGDVRQVMSDENGLYIKCATGKHHLAGQVSECGGYYVGLYPK